MKIITLFLATMLLIVAMLPTNRPEGAVILVGGGRIPTQAIELLKESKVNGKFVVISYCEDHRHKWDVDLDFPIFSLPTEFSSIPVCDIAGVLIAGGDQWRYLNEIDPQHLQLVHERGAPILGTSAGAMILGEHYFTAEKDTITSEQARQNINVCLGRSFVHFQCLKDTIVDTHFRNRNREGRLDVFRVKSGAKRALGIDEQTAMFIRGSRIETIGEGTVTILNDKPISVLAKL